MHSFGTEEFGKTPQIQDSSDFSGLVYLKMNLSAPPVPGTSVEVTASVMADLYSFDNLEYIFSVPSYFKVKGSKRGVIKKVKLWEWVQKKITIHIPQTLPVTEAGKIDDSFLDDSFSLDKRGAFKKSIYFLVKGDFDFAAVSDWIENDENLDDNQKQTLTLRINNLNEKIETGDYLDIYTGPGECFFGKPPWSALFTPKMYALITDDPKIDEQSTAWTDQELKDQYLELAGLDSKSIKAKLLQARIRKNRIKLCTGLVLQHNFKRARKILNDLLREFENKDTALFPHHKRLEYVILSNLGALVNNKDVASEFLKITNLLNGPCFADRYEKELAVYSRYNYGLALLDAYISDKADKPGKTLEEAEKIMVSLIKNSPRLIAARAVLMKIHSLRPEKGGKK
jgi:hypothetical protein